MSATSTTTESPADGTNNMSRQKRYPARFSLEIEGLEWFIYNRSAAYDLLETYLKKSCDLSDSPDTDETGSPTDESLPREERSFVSTSQESAKLQNNLLGALLPIADIFTGLENQAYAPDKLQLSRMEYLFMRFLPLQLKLFKGAAIIGNKTTPSLMVFHFQAGRGTVDASRPSNPLDKYKLCYSVDFQKPVIELLPNIHYDHAEDKRKSEIHSWSNYSFFSQLMNFKPMAKVMQLLKSIGISSTQANMEETTSSGPNLDTQESWRGLSRYRLNEDNDVELQDYRQRVLKNDDNTVKEYAKFSTIMDSAQGSVLFYYDVPGIIPESSVQIPSSTYSGADIGNHGSAPEWGVDLAFTSTTIHYGPWADRQRIPLQRMLYPLNYHNFSPQGKRSPGELRDYTEFKMVLELKENTIFRIPMRESSKNAHYASEGLPEALDEDDGREKDTSGNLVRPFGWIEVKASEPSTVSYTSSMIPTAKDGWKATVRADLNEIELRSSVNHELLFTASSHIVDADISNTLKWNELQQWLIKNDSYDVKTFFVREHVMLLSDLVNDFSDGPPIAYDLFTPFIYRMNWKIHDSYGIFLNVNDLNIINNPSDFDENTYIAFQGKDLDMSFAVPMDQVYQKKNTVTFSIKVSSFGNSCFWIC